MFGDLAWRLRALALPQELVRRGERRLGTPEVSAQLRHLGGLQLLL